MSARFVRLAPLAAVILFFSACATQTATREVNAPGSQTPAVATNPEYQVPQVLPQTVTPVPSNVPRIIVPLAGVAKNIETSGASPAVISLVHKAQTERDAGKLETSEATLARALRIEPRNAFVWSALASVHLARKQYEEAENEAQKSISLSRGNPYLEAPNWRTIADSRAARGDAGGALQARAQSDQSTQEQTRSQ